jgi:hypothetical protein
MLEESMSSSHSQERFLCQEEKHLVRDLVERTRKGNEVLDSLDAIKVVDLSDGGMGSIRTVPLDNQKRKAIPIASANYYDRDDILISVQITCDESGRLFEIDIWKTDFSPVIRYPSSAYRVTAQE